MLLHCPRSIPNPSNPSVLVPDDSDCVYVSEELYMSVAPRGVRDFLYYSLHESEQTTKALTLFAICTFDIQHIIIKLLWDGIGDQDPLDGSFFG